MENRICIDGVWFVREELTETKIEPTPKEEVTNSLSCVWENDDWCFESSLILRGEDPTDYYPGISIEVTCKVGGRVNWKKNYIDNPFWMLGVLENNYQSLDDSKKIFDEDGLKVFKSFLQYLVDRNWLKK